MGLFLQKTNIIRDYLEDLQDGRTWWPTEIWSKYTNSLSQLAQPTSSKEAVACLNHLITDALRHVPDVFKYMSRLRDQTVFNFCAIPQVSLAHSVLPSHCFAIACLICSFLSMSTFHLGVIDLFVVVSVVAARLPHRPWRLPR